MNTQMFQRGVFTSLWNVHRHHASVKRHQHHRTHNSRASLAIVSPLVAALQFDRVPLMFHSILSHLTLLSFCDVLFCVLVSHVCSGVLRALFVRVWRCFENAPRSALRVVVTLVCTMSWIFLPSKIFVLKSASLRVPGMFRIVASRL